MILLVSAIVVGLVWVAVDDDLVIRTSDLEVSEADTGTDPLEYTLQFTRDGGVFGHLDLELRGDTLRVNLRHPPDLTARSVELVLLRSGAGAPPPEVALRAPGGVPWPPIEFGKTADGLGTRVAVDDLGIQGRGSTTIELQLLEQPRDWRLTARVALQPADRPILERYVAAAEAQVSETGIEDSALQ